MRALLQFTLPVLPSRSASPLRLLFLPSSFCRFAQFLSICSLCFFSFLFCRFAPSISQFLPICVFCFFFFSLQHYAWPSQPVNIFFSFLSVTLSIALSWWVSKFLQLKGKGF
ncbi:hypothetical protein ES332_D12G100600v1 [Gossypium tomentosum]|uniref:Uncharacterized protein n=1 Tax=Gossypium tomentosum TaxID=34277 RepID=A0A5D2I6Q6_GOSTO|nr:hypothetical protein ES332_D12G100600v1 [Gossypium tomentosum]